MSPPPPIPPNTAATLSLSPIPTPTHGSGGTFSVACSAHIAATPRTCLDIVLKAADYPSWNRFCKKCDINSQPRSRSSSPTKKRAASRGGEITILPDNGPDYLKLGTKFTFDVHMNNPQEDTTTSSSSPTSGRATALEITVLEPIDEVVQDTTPPSSSHTSSSSPETTSTAAALALTAAAAAKTTRHRRRVGYRVAWKTRPTYLLPSFLLRSERVQEFAQVDAPFGAPGESETVYACWETFYGVLAPVVRATVGAQLENGFGVWTADLKGRAEEVERRDQARV